MVIIKKLFGASKQLEIEIEKYLDKVDEGLMVFKRDVTLFIEKKYDEFYKNLEEIKEIEREADDYQKDIKYKLYKYMLIPDARGDVLSLLEDIDNIVDKVKKVLIQLSIEKPDILQFLEEDFIELTEKTVKTSTVLLRAFRNYFNGSTMVNEHVNKVHFYEHEVDKIEERLKKKIFEDGKIDNLCHKVHLRYFSEEIALLSDIAEKISENISVAAIKRSI